MQGYNVIALFNAEIDKLLMCTRKKEPYKGLNNLVGGKIEAGEDGLAAAYRELAEETGVTRSDVILTHLMDFTYHLSNCYVEVYVGKLKSNIEVFGDENDLYWSGLSHDFFDMDKYAGEGNIGHMLEQVKLNEKELFAVHPSDVWFHGSNLELDILAEGSTITQWKELAEAFATKPAALGYEEVFGEISHNGTQKGILYVIDEDITMGVDIYQHPRTTMDAGVEFLTKRPLRLKRV